MWKTLLLSGHPVMQLAATLAAFVVLRQGIGRFRSLHLKQRTTFDWRSHVRWGTTVLAFWGLGSIGGAVAMALTWPGTTAGIHGRLGLAMVLMIIFGLGSGYRMNKIKKKRRWLPLAHGLNNMALVLLAMAQAYAGWNLYSFLVLGW